MDILMKQSFLGELFAPMARALAQVPGTDVVSRVLSMANSIGLEALRHLNGMRTLREQVLLLLHRKPGTAQCVALARSTWSDALSSRRSRAVLQAVMASLLTDARAARPGRLAQFPALQGRPVYPMDGTYQSESAHYGRCTPRRAGRAIPRGTPPPLLRDYLRAIREGHDLSQGRPVAGRPRFDRRAILVWPKKALGRDYDHAHEKGNRLLPLRKRCQGNAFAG